MIKTNELKLFSYCFSINYPIVPLAAIWYIRTIFFSCYSKFLSVKRMIFLIVEVNMSKNTRPIIYFIIIIIYYFIYSESM